jgi:hypothetical protein
VRLLALSVRLLPLLPLLPPPFFELAPQLTDLLEK